MGLCYIFARMKITKSTLTNKKMKRTILLIAALASFANIFADGIRIEKKINNELKKNYDRVVSITPTSAYDPMKRILFIWTNKGECDVTISIYKDDEEVAYETIFVGPGEEISCDFSDCHAGEYTIYTTINGEMELIDTITVN